MSHVKAASSRGSWWKGDGRLDAESLAALLLRLIIGMIFVMQGTGVFGWFGGTGGAAGKEEFVRFLGYHPVTPIMLLLTITEIATGLLLIAGLLTPLAAAGAIGIGFNLIFNLGWNQGFLGGEAGPGYALAAVLSVAAFSLALIGPGRYSFEKVLGWSIHGVRLALLAGALGIGMGIGILTIFGPGFGGFKPPPSQTLRLTPNEGQQASNFIATGTGYQPCPGAVLFLWDQQDEEHTTLGSNTPDAEGNISSTLTVPALAGLGSHRLSTHCQSESDPPRAESMFIVTP